MTNLKELLHNKRSAQQYSVLIWEKNKCGGFVDRLLFDTQIEALDAIKMLKAHAVDYDCYEYTIEEAQND